MPKSPVVKEVTPDVPAPQEADPIEQIVAPLEQVSTEPPPEVIPAPDDEQPANHFGVWPTSYGQRVRGVGFDGIGTITKYGEVSCVILADINGETYIVARTELGVVEG